MGKGQTVFNSKAKLAVRYNASAVKSYIQCNICKLVFWTLKCKFTHRYKYYFPHQCNLTHTNTNFYTKAYDKASVLYAYSDPPYLICQRSAELGDQVFLCCQPPQLRPAIKLIRDIAQIISVLTTAISIKQNDQITASHYQCCQMVCFQTKKYRFG
jgi:hypothetical protein